MLLNLGIALIVLTMVGLFILGLMGRLTFGSAIGFALAGILAGIVIPIVPHIQRVAIGLGGGKSVSVDVQDAVQVVQARASEVRALTDEVTNLAKQVQESQKNVLQMQDNIRMAYRTLFETLVFLGNSSLIIAPPPLLQQLNRQIDEFAKFAFRTPQEEQADFVRITTIVKTARAARATPSPTSKPTPRPVPQASSTPLR